MNMIDLSFCVQTARLWQLVGKVINIMKIVVPIIIVLLATIDLGKAVMAGEEKEIKTAQKLVIKRLIYGVVLFFAVTIVQTVFGLVNSDYKTVGGSDIQGKRCWNCVLQPNSSYCKNYVKASKKCKSTSKTDFCKKYDISN